MARQKTPQAKARPLRVLVVDDCQDTLTSFRQILEPHGIDVATACSAQHAVDSVKKKHPDVLVMEVNLPVVDGYDIAEEIMLHLPRKPLCIAMTASPRERPRAEAVKEGFNFYLVKPVDATELVDIIRKYGGDGVGRISNPPGRNGSTIRPKRSS